ncbi:MAG: carboxypeptidase-like regulatory domain-containing protein [Polyangia bacterium]|jgi:hypothetical protein|nr:carboxypeptidase-like regulatory domain-containing protein [Polyangia bacterium]
MRVFTSRDRFSDLGPRLAHVFLLVCCIVLPDLVGCGAGSKGGLNTVEHEPCDVDTDCSSEGEVCSAHKVCLPLFTGPLSYGLELSPPSDTSLNSGAKLAQYEVAPLDLDVVNGKAAVQLPEAIVLRGAVMVVGDSPVPLEATVTIARRSMIPGRPKVMTSRNVLASGFLLRPNLYEIDPSFEAALTRDASHTIRALPDASNEESYHPLVMETRFDSDESIWLVFGDPETSIYAAGYLVDALGVGVEGARVRAVGQDDGFLSSSTGTTDSGGFFHLRLPRGVRTYALTVGPGTEGQGIPEVTREGLVIGAQAEEQGALNTFDNPEALGTFQLPAYPTPQRFLFSLQGRSSNGEDAVIPGATVTFSTRIGQPSGLSGIYSVTALSDDNGVVSVDLVPGTTAENRVYEAVVLPPSSSEFAVAMLTGEASISLGAVGGAAPPIQLSRRVSYAGQVLDSSLAPAIDLLVQARRLDGPSGIRGSLRTGTTKELGRFSLKLDPGTYAIELIPPTGLSLPRWVLPNDLLIDEASSPVIEASSFVLPNASVLEVQVSGLVADTNTALSGVSVSVYLLDDFCSTLHSQDYALCDREPVFIGDGVTDSTGRARVLVPGS